MPVTALETALYTKLANTSALTTELGGTYVYNTNAPQNPPAKYVVFQYQGGGDVNDTKQRSRNVLYAVYGVAQGRAAAAAVDGQIDTALHLGSLTVSGWANNLWLARERDVNFTEQDSTGRPRHRIGGFYRAIIDED